MAERNKSTQLLFEVEQERNLYNLCEEIYNRTYKPSPPICFLIKEPTYREVFAPAFKDRIVSHLLFNSIAPIFEKTFIYDSYSCRKGKGTLFGINRMEYFLRSCTEDYKYLNETWVLSLDISGYFMSIHRPTLYKLVMNILNKYQYQHLYKGSKQLWDDVIDYSLCEYLISGLLLRDPRDGVTIINKDSDDWNLLPPNKSLFNAPKNTGLPIGDLTSQLFSNIYLGQFDQFMKRDLGCRYYGRYVDDSRIISRDKQFLQDLIPKADEYLKDKLSLSLHPKKTQIQPAKFGINFLGQIIRPHRRYAKNKTIKSFSTLAWKLSKKEDITGKDISSVNSYLGYFQWVREFGELEKIIKRSGLNKILDFDNNYKTAKLR